MRARSNAVSLMQGRPAIGAHIRASIARLQGHQYGRNSAGMLLKSGYLGSRNSNEYLRLASRRRLLASSSAESRNWKAVYQGIACRLRFRITHRQPQAAMCTHMTDPPCPKTLQVQWRSLQSPSIQNCLLLYFNQVPPSHHLKVASGLPPNGMQECIGTTRECEYCQKEV